MERPYRITYRLKGRRIPGRHPGKDSSVTSSFVTRSAAHARLAELKADPNATIGFCQGPYNDLEWWAER